MRYSAAIFLLFLLISACEKEEEVLLVAYNAEAFAYDIGDSWEVNASTRVKGFKQREEEEKFFHSIAYDVDLITPGGDTLWSLITRVEDKDSDEKLMDIPVEVQFELDSTYVPGTYILIFRISDPERGGHAVSSAEFELTE